MIKTYQLLDGGKITASSPQEFLKELREGSLFDSNCTDEEFMVRFARRYKELHGTALCTDTPEKFLQNLEESGYII